MSHQQGEFWDSTVTVDEDGNETDGDFIKGDFDDDVKFPIIYEHGFYNHYGTRPVVGQLIDMDGREGKIIIRSADGARDENGKHIPGSLQSNLGGGYLECSGILENHGPFFSIVATEDQWGTYYDMKLGDGPVVTFPQAWSGEDRSFIRQLGHALIKFADVQEPRDKGESIVGGIIGIGSPERGM